MSTEQPFESQVFVERPRKKLTGSSALPFGQQNAVRGRE